ncbi:MAG: antibiotic biosynthesis monooxygenase [Proteobacteria bacterium]|nr:antibiotic biosynthesis monooxygenase [Pseudomonadota bacterium]MBU1583595.1 antibiotic biosynthesis monooxygenase [Pseudomonadota bacterium]MBU2452486.1 antibiotic biosynthesis monooxygenase [Pseudomonadota bacterium]MBU2629901.1 antibiotic biosynthesis monooxygenase [Pseudomonadota bacterium]
MAVSVIIQRTVRDEKTAALLAPMIVKLRSMATAQPGYITGQAFSCLDCEGEYMVISTWANLEDWNLWMHKEERQAIQKKIDELLGEKTGYRYYEPIVGGITPVFKGDAA